MQVSRILVVSTLGPANPSGFQELAMNSNSAAKLVGWGARVLYLGPAFGLTPHRNATAVLAVGLDGALEVADDPEDRATRYRAARSHMFGMTPSDLIKALRIAD